MSSGKKATLRVQYREMAEKRTTAQYDLMWNIKTKYTPQRDHIKYEKNGFKCNRDPKLQK